MKDAERAIQEESLIYTRFKESISSAITEAKSIAHHGDGYGGELRRIFDQELKKIVDEEPKRIGRKRQVKTAVRMAVFERDGFRCKACGSDKNLSCDHIVPECQGGTSHIDNLQTLCVSCNSKKGTKTQG